MELDDEKIRVVVSEAVLQSLDETGRNALIQAQMLFNRAVKALAISELEKSMASESSSLRAHLRELHEEAAKHVFDNGEVRDKIVETIASGIRRMITGELY